MKYYYDVKGYTTEKNFDDAECEYLTECCVFGNIKNARLYTKELIESSKYPIIKIEQRVDLKEDEYDGQDNYTDSEIWRAVVKAKKGRW